MHTGLFLKDTTSNCSGNYLGSISSMLLLLKLRPCNLLRLIKFYKTEIRLSLRAKYSKFIRWSRPSILVIRFYMKQEQRAGGRG